MGAAPKSLSSLSPIYTVLSSGKRVCLDKPGPASKPYIQIFNSDPSLNLEGLLGPLPCHHAGESKTRKN